MPTLHTIGYEKASLDEMIAALRAAGVKTIIDVREHPVSRRPGFSKGALSRALAAAGVGYCSVTALGTPKPGQEAAKEGRLDDFHAIFAAHLATPAAEAALAAVAGRLAAGEAGLCLLCYERDPAQCHRSLVAAAIARLIAVEVVHLTAGGPGSPFLP